MSRLKAYTILELIVVMLLSAVVISIAYSSFHLVQKRFGQFKASQESVVRSVLLDRLLNHDVGQAQKVRRTETGLACHFPQKTVVYQFAEERIVRTEPGAQDTFLLQLADVRVLRQQMPVTQPDGLVDEVCFGNQLDPEQTYHYAKHYAADVLLEEPAAAAY